MNRTLKRITPARPVAVMMIRGTLRIDAPLAGMNLNNWNPEALLAWVRNIVHSAALLKSKTGICQRFDHLGSIHLAGMRTQFRKSLQKSGWRNIGKLDYCPNSVKHGVHKRRESIYQ